MEEDNQSSAAGIGVETSENMDPSVFSKLETASQILSAKIVRSLESRRIDKRYTVEAGVYVSPKILEELSSRGIDQKNVTTQQILEIAKERNFPVAYYSGGIGYGIVGNDSEFYRPMGVAGKMADIPDNNIPARRLHERIFTSTGKVEHLQTAQDFLVEDFDIVFSSEPPQKRGILSSPAADATARKTIFQEIKESGVILTEADFWSNSVFKLTREFLAAYFELRADTEQAVKIGLLPDKDAEIFENGNRFLEKNPANTDIIMTMRVIGTELANRKTLTENSMEKVKDALLKVKMENLKKVPIPDEYPHRYEERLMPVHGSGYDALIYLEQFKDVDIIMGGGPEGADSLTYPFDLGDKTPLGKIKSNIGIPIARHLVKYLGDNDQSPFFDAILTGRQPSKKIRRWLYKNVSDEVRGNRDHKLFPVYAALMTGSYLPGNFDLLVSRLAEMGRAYTPSKRQIEKRSTGQLMSRVIMTTLRGEGISSVIVSPGVGDVVDDTKSKVASTLEAMIPETTIVVAGKPEVPHEGEYVRTVHGLMREKGLLSQVRGIIAAKKLGFINTKRSEVKQAGRVGPAETEPVAVSVSGSQKREELTYDLNDFLLLEKSIESGEADPKTIRLYQRFKEMFVKGKQRLYPTSIPEMSNWKRNVLEVLSLFFNDESYLPRAIEYDRRLERKIPQSLNPVNTNLKT